MNNTNVINPLLKKDFSIKQKEQLENYPTEEVKSCLPDGVEVEGVYVGEEAIHKLEESQTNKIQLPPYPDGIFDWTEEDLKLHSVPEDIIKSNKVAQYKLLKLWDVWGNLRTNEKLIEIINTNLTSTDSDEFFLKQIIVSIVDIQGKILNGKTNLSEDIFGTNNLL